MTDSINPYETPQHAGSAPVAASKPTDSLDIFALFGWPVVFGLNLIVPLLFGWEMTRNQGRLGMALASGALLTAGWVLCVVRPGWARRLIFGGLCTALTQFFPILHVVAGIVAILSAGALGLSLDHGNLAPLLGELAGFFVTFMVAIQVLACAAGAGVVIGLVAPTSLVDRTQPF